jgi:hypothetical protein
MSISIHMALLRVCISHSLGRSFLSPASAFLFFIRYQRVHLRSTSQNGRYLANIIAKLYQGSIPGRLVMANHPSLLAGTPKQRLPHAEYLLSLVTAWMAASQHELTLPLAGSEGSCNRHFPVVIFEFGVTRWVYSGLVELNQSISSLQTPHLES